LHYTAGIGIILSENEAADTIAENGGGCDTVLTLALAPGTRQMDMGFVYGCQSTGWLERAQEKARLWLPNASLDHNRRQDA